MFRFAYPLLAVGILGLSVVAQYVPDDVGEAPCGKIACCFDTFCCGPGTEWNGLTSRCDVATFCTIPGVVFDQDNRCFAAICVGEECCGEGASLVPDPSRDGDACYCSAGCDMDSKCAVKKDTSACKKGDNAKVIKPPGELDIKGSSCIFISDSTVEGDKMELMKDAPGVGVAEGMTSWDDVIKKLEMKKDKPLKGDIVLSGHGTSGGGVAVKNGTPIDGESITQDEANRVKNCLAQGARIVITSCAQGDKDMEEGMQRLANLTMRSVVGNVKDVNDGANGKGDWVQYDPKMSP
jgi:hypothetical protein